MSENALPKGYEPKEIEGRWRARWESEKTFTPNLDSPAAQAKNTYCIVIPPPNVTGSLHMGHALNLTLQDILCRHARQKGKEVLWVPGTDHAGIATQNVVERQLAKEGKTRHDLGRDEFIKRVWAWREDYGGRILNQLRAIGASVDWTRERFTMDEGLSRAVRHVFVRLYKEGLIYKGDYIINWCTRCHTALADDEVEHAAQKTHIWRIKYPLEDGSGFVTVATTRPETMLGDSAVCVNPEDERYRAVIGKKLRLPLTERVIPIIADKYVEMDFGTGALKVTPSHDHNDWQLGFKHHLEFIQVIDDEGRMNAKAGKFAGLFKSDARKAVVEDLEKAGLLEAVEDYENKVGLCYRCKEVIEPHVSTQWFVSVRPLAEKARAAVPGQTRIVPESWLKTYYNWMDNIRDWCISRQIWWGHRIPAWTCLNCNKLIVEEEAPAACPDCGHGELKQEDDVLDTWFSSALWPFSTLGWPEKTRELELFYPTSVLVTGFDILFFWVARMLMMGLHFMGEVPFRDVYIHALVRDFEGRKMSKSSGNVIDPLLMIDKYGTDSLRFTLAAFAAMGRDIKLSEERIEGYRHFVNKIWNAARFALMNLEETPPALPPGHTLEGVQGTHHAWILHRLEEMKGETDRAISEYRFNDASQGLYKFIWNEFCDWYLELIKPDFAPEAVEEAGAVARHTLWTVLKETLLLLHPIMPFVTAEVWNVLPGLAGGDIARELFPAARPACLKPEAAARMEMVQEAIVAVRTIRAELNISPALRLKVLIRPQNEDSQVVLSAHAALIAHLARLEGLEVAADGKAPRASASQVACGNEIIVFLEGAVDFAAEKLRLEKEIIKLDKERDMLEGKLQNPNYTEKAPREIVEQNRARVAELKDAAAKLAVLRQRFLEAME